MGVYDPLTRHLKALPSDTWNVNFSEIERIIARPLPKSAHEHRPWWANQRDSNHSQAKAWREAGWEVREVNLPSQTVRFERIPGPGGPVGDEPCSPVSLTDGLEALFTKAAGLTGEDDRSRLTELALNALIQRETAAYLGTLGGTMPEARAAPRRRFPWQS